MTLRNDTQFSGHKPRNMGMVGKMEVCQYTQPLDIDLMELIERIQLYLHETPLGAKAERGERLLTSPVSLTSTRIAVHIWRFLEMEGGGG